jgi:hypothetical protein
MEPGNEARLLSTQEVPQAKKRAQAVIDFDAGVFW